jgi:cell division septum initiation protein DivIVA
MLFGGGATVKILAVLAIVVIVAGGAWYVTGLRADLVVARANAEKLQQGIEQQQALMSQMRADIAQIQSINAELNQEAARARDEVKNLTDRFSVNARGEARDFGATAAAKPQVVERLVNRGTVNAMRCLEIASGAPLTEAERNAKTSSEINRECPSIANPNYQPAPGR